MPFFLVVASRRRRRRSIVRVVDNDILGSSAPAAPDACPDKLLPGRGGQSVLRVAEPHAASLEAARRHQTRVGSEVARGLRALESEASVRHRDALRQERDGHVSRRGHNRLRGVVEEHRRAPPVQDEQQQARQHHCDEGRTGVPLRAHLHGHDHEHDHGEPDRATDAEHQRLAGTAVRAPRARTVLPERLRQPPLQRLLRHHAAAPPPRRRRPSPLRRRAAVVLTAAFPRQRDGPLRRRRRHHRVGSARRHRVFQLAPCRRRRRYPQSGGARHEQRVVGGHAGAGDLQVELQVERRLPWRDGGGGRVRQRLVRGDAAGPAADGHVAVRAEHAGHRRLRLQHAEKGLPGPWRQQRRRRVVAGTVAVVGGKGAWVYERRRLRAAARRVTVIARVRAGRRVGSLGAACGHGTRMGQRPRALPLSPLLPFVSR
eukprot:Rhum_TRINITY_DN7504_c0_g1::Rhum_TRINITY_DN7504_c0_g1_i1::g.23267::m.23267